MSCSGLPTPPSCWAMTAGIHAKRWTRERAIEFMIENSGMPRGDVTAEIERYIVAPGQACAYKMGQLKILELRDRAKETLGEAFDLRAFNDVILADRANAAGALAGALARSGIAPGGLPDGGDRPARRHFDRTGRGQAVRRSPARGRRRGGTLSGDPHGAVVRRREAPGRRRRCRGPGGEAPRHRTARPRRAGGVGSRPGLTVVSPQATLRM